MEKPWFKQFWPWFLIILPGTVIIWTLATVVVFSQNAVSLVSDDYYKEGKGINQDITRLQEAKALNLNASVYSQDQTLVVTLDKGKLEQYPALRVNIVHRTLETQDIELMISADAQGNYRIQPETEIVGPWFVKLSSFDNKWILQGKVNFPSTTPTILNNNG
ncbi:FixH family protein [Vibrio sp. RC27]